MNPAQPKPSLPIEDAASRLFSYALVAAALVKGVLAFLLPLTGDEAYFVVWGRHLDYGYYDHGAMTGWWIALTQLLGKSVFVLRLPAIVAGLAGAWLLRAMLRPVDPVRADFAAAFYLLSPAVLLNVLFTTDTPLILLSLVAGWFAVRASRSEKLGDWVLAGFFLGLAFLAKYFAVLLGLAFAVHLLLRGGRRRFTGILAILAGAAPGVAVNVAWNVNHGWTNVLFNVYTRNVDAHLSLLSPLALIAFGLFALGGPVVSYFLLWPRQAGRRSWSETWRALQETRTEIPLFAVGVPGLVFLAVSLAQGVGLHWLLSFFPFFFPVLAVKFDVPALERLRRPTVILAGICTVVALVLLALPIEVLKRHRSYHSIIMATQPEAVLAQVAPFTADHVLVTPSYTQSAQLGFHLGRDVPVIGPGSHHGREDDFRTDFRALDGRNLMVLSARAQEAEATRLFFETSERREIEVRGARLTLVLGRGFKFAAYREAVLRPIALRYYRLPAWLAPLSRPAPFILRYGLEREASP